MRISWNWLSELVDLGEIKTPEKLAELLTSRGLEVESIQRLDQGFEKVLIAQILNRSPHPQADRLSLCQVTTGTGAPLEIVCGAQNMKAGDRVALAQVGAHLPNGVKIAAGKIRGVVSNGMLCSEEELKLKESSEGILILPESAPLGENLAKFLGLNDALFELKPTANRGDCLSHLGIAREVKAALGFGSVRHPSPKPGVWGSLDSDKSYPVFLEAGDQAPQFLGCLVEGVKIGPSPEWLVSRLGSLGHRSINNVVDASNWVMLELGQPLHAYDADKIQGGQIHVRLSRDQEILPLLDGQTITLTGQELVIADRDRAVALAGVMGGGNSEVSSHTQRLFLECAQFDARRVRRAASRFQLKTDASQRFEKGIDPLGLRLAMERFIQLVLNLAGGQLVGMTEVSRSVYEPRHVEWGIHEIHDFLGFPRDQAPLTYARMTEFFQALDCQVEGVDQKWRVTPPSYRGDLVSKVDFAEEVARSVGYDAIPSTLPPLTSSPIFSVSSTPQMSVMGRAKASLVQSGLQEVVNFAFTSKKRLADFQMISSVSVLNPLSEEYAVMVPSLLPGLIQNALDNWNHHFGSEPLAIRLFELRPVFSTLGAIEAKDSMSTGVEESWKLALCVTGPRYAEALKNERGEVDFYDLKAIFERLLVDLGVRGVRMQPMSESRTQGSSLLSLFHPGQSIEILAGNSVAGYLGQFHPGYVKNLKTRGPLWIAELDWKLLSQFSRAASESPSFKTWPQFPSMERDFALLVKEGVTVDRICQVALKLGKPLVKKVKVFDIYRGTQVAQGMTSVAVRVIFYDEGRSLQESEAEAVSARIQEGWKKELGAELRG